jgi:hypothetical protein
MTKPRWSDKLARPVRDAVDDVTLRTRSDARRYMTKLPERRALYSQWQIAARLLLDGTDAGAVTDPLETALLFDGRLDAKLANEGLKQLGRFGVVNAPAIAGHVPHLRRTSRRTRAHPSRRTIPVTVAYWHAVTLRRYRRPPWAFPP